MRSGDAGPQANEDEFVCRENLPRPALARTNPAATTLLGGPVAAGRGPVAAQLAFDTAELQMRRSGGGGGRVSNMSDVNR